MKMHRKMSDSPRMGKKQQDASVYCDHLKKAMFNSIYSLIIS